MPAVPFLACCSLPPSLVSTAFSCSAPLRRLPSSGDPILKPTPARRCTSRPASIFLFRTRSARLSHHKATETRIDIDPPHDAPRHRTGTGPRASDIGAACDEQGADAGVQAMRFGAARCDSMRRDMVPLLASGSAAAWGGLGAGGAACGVRESRRVAGRAGTGKGGAVGRCPILCCADVSRSGGGGGGDGAAEVGVSGGAEDGCAAVESRPEAGTGTRGWMGAQDKPCGGGGEGRGVAGGGGRGVIPEERIGFLLLTAQSNRLAWLKPLLSPSASQSPYHSPERGLHSRQLHFLKRLIPSRPIAPHCAPSHRGGAGHRVGAHQIAVPYGDGDGIDTGSPLGPDSDGTLRTWSLRPQVEAELQGRGYRDPESWASRHRLESEARCEQKEGVDAPEHGARITITCDREVDANRGWPTSRSLNLASRAWTAWLVAWRDLCSLTLRPRTQTSPTGLAEWLAPNHSTISLLTLSVSLTSVPSGWPRGGIFGYSLVCLPELFSVSPRFSPFSCLAKTAEEPTEPHMFNYISKAGIGSLYQDASKEILAYYELICTSYAQVIRPTSQGQTCDSNITNIVENYFWIIVVGVIGE
ncbi:hypothetical protein DFH08DRAFT_941344 [Mycena albidolilacea]|uniref:Uncharacterized protein n=1 Tax=Mycena albidolilacea TaxID=1033008 RepID=A0AAD6ZI98_9AGAR|nr:hypothetical protein DFH08DRAFT_941344 [Mycena albidolilacea]